MSYFYYPSPYPYGYAAPNSFRSYPVQYHPQNAAFSGWRSAYPVSQPSYPGQMGGYRFAEMNDIVLKDYGPNPFVVDIEAATKQNDTFRTAVWTGSKLQVTLMSINVGEDIGLETHPNTDQFIRIEAGQGVVQMGDSKDRLDFVRRVEDDDAIMIPAGKWHNVKNTGNTPLKLYSIYAPPEHPFGTVHKTKADAMAAEKN